MKINNMLTIQKLRKETVGFKPTKIPPGFKMVICPNEQLGLFLGKRNHFQIIRKHLRIPGSRLTYADYSIKGFEFKAAIERKMLSDLLSYVGSDREHTEIKLEFIKDFYFKALVIELKEEELFNLPDWTQMSPESIRGFLKMVRDKGIHVYINHNRPALERWVLDSLTYAYIQMRKV